MCSGMFGSPSESLLDPGLMRSTSLTRSHTSKLIEYLLWDLSFYDKECLVSHVMALQRIPHTTKVLDTTITLLCKIVNFLVF